MTDRLVELVAAFTVGMIILGAALAWCHVPIPLIGS